MAFKITMGTAEAQELQNSIQQELAKFEYAPEDDPVMAEYITVMLANNKTSDQITEELVDLVGDNYEPSFTTWLFSRASGEGASRAVKAEEVDPSAEQQVEAALDSERASPPHRQPNQGAVFAQALAGASSNPSSNQKRTASMRDGSPSAAGEPLSKRRTSSGAAGAGAALPTGPGSGGKNLLDRMGGAQGNEIRNNQDAFQTKIDTLTQNSAQMGASLGMPPQQQQIVPSFPSRNTNQHQQQRGGMNMGGYGGGGGMGMNGMGMGGYGGGMGMGMGVQEMMLAQMAQMQFMQQQMQQFAQQGGLLPQNQQQQVPFSGGPQRTNGGSNRPSHHNQAPRAGGAGAGGRASPKTYTPTLAKPTDPTLCKFSLGCSNAQCPYSHPSPVATPETALVLSTEPCELQRKCKDPDCLKSHVSPASVSGHAGPSQLPCKYQNCNNPSCPFLHTDDQGNPIPPPALTNPSLAVPHTKKDPKFSSSAPAPTSSKPWLKNGGGGGGFSPYTKSKPSAAINASMGGMNKSVKFNPEAKAFVPKSTSTSASHISDRLVDQTEGGGEKIIPSASPAAPAPASASSTPASAPAPAVIAPEVKKEVEA